MTRLFQSGWETGLVEQVGAASVGANSGAVSVVSTAPAPRSGAYCLKCVMGDPTGTATGTSNHAGRLTVAHAALGEVWYAVGLFAHRFAEVTVPGFVVLRAADAVGNVNVLLFLDTGVIRAYVATAGTSSPTSAQLTLLGTATASMSYDAWHLIEVRLVGSTGAGGTVEVYLDGAQVINATGVRTAQTTATYAAVALEMCNQVANATTENGTSYHAFDDLRVNSTAGSRNTGRPGDESILLLRPNAPGDLTQLTRGGTDSGANWSQVDEVPPTGTGDYVFSDTVGQTDLYNLPTVAVSAVSAIEVLVQGFNSGGGGSITLPTKTGAGQSDGSAVSLTATPTIYRRLLEADPADSAAWSQTKIDALQIGVKVAS